jgi:hypothetical protein
MNQRRIVIDGKTYNGVNEMPPEVRARYEQAMESIGDESQDGVPKAYNRPQMPGVVSSTSMKIVVDGKDYTRVEDLPADALAKYESAMAGLDKDRNGIPDFIENMNGLDQKPFASVNSTMDANPNPASYAPPTASSAVAPDTSSGWMLVLTAVVVLCLCTLGAAGVIYYFMR